MGPGVFTTWKVLVLDEVSVGVSGRYRKVGGSARMACISMTSTRSETVDGWYSRIGVTMVFTRYSTVDHDVI